MDKGHSKCKGSEVGTSGVDSGNGGEAGVAEGQRGLGGRDLELIRRAKGTSWRDTICLRF